MPSEKGIVHVIDDDEAIARIAGFPAAHRAARGDRLIRPRPPFSKRFRRDGLSCVITDMRMPGMSGHRSAAAVAGTEDRACR